VHQQGVKDEGIVLAAAGRQGRGLGLVGEPDDFLAEDAFAAGARLRVARAGRAASACCASGAAHSRRRQ